MGQIAVSGVAALAAVGSTILLSYCVSPYVHDLTVQKNEKGEVLYTATTGNMFGMRTKTTFPLKSCIELEKSGMKRPFCNVIVNGGDKALFIHGELFDDKNLLKRLLLRNLTKSETEGRSGDHGKKPKDED